MTRLLRDPVVVRRLAEAAVVGLAFAGLLATWAAGAGAWSWLVYVVLLMVLAGLVSRWLSLRDRRLARQEAEVER